MTVTMAMSPDSKELYLMASPRYTDLLRKIPGLHYDKTADAWRAPAKLAIAIAARGVLGDYLELTPAAIEWAEKAKRWVRFTDTLKEGGYHASWLDDQPLFPLYPFQEIGVQVLAFCEKVLMADEMGTGKTVQAAVALDMLSTNDDVTRPSPFPALIVCTNSMKWTWQRELKKWLDIESIVIDGTAPKRKKQFATDTQDEKVVIINWDALRLHSRLAPYGSVSLTEDEKTDKELNQVEWATVIADECHKAKDPTKKQTRALFQISKNATYRWALTGTPITGKADDLWSIMHFVDPDAYGSKSKWLDRYAIVQLDERGHPDSSKFNPATLTEMGAALRPQFIRRTKAEVLTQLPPKVYRQVWVEMGAKQLKAYKDMTKEMIAQLDQGLLIASVGVVQSMRLGQIASGVPVLDEQGEVIELTMPSCKVDALLDILEESDDQLVVGAESRLLIELCARELERKKISHVLITGHVSTEDRELNVARFQGGHVRVCLCTLGAGAEGITLTAASRLVFLQRSFKMTANLQFQDRIHRIGQEADSVEIIDVLTSNSTDVDRWEISQDKEETAQVVYRDPAYVRQRLLA